MAHSHDSTTLTCTNKSASRGGSGVVSSSLRMMDTPCLPQLVNTSPGSTCIYSFASKAYRPSLLGVSPNIQHA
eukprot:749562-Amphidinium_carterae.1